MISCKIFVVALAVLACTWAQNIPNLPTNADDLGNLGNNLGDATGSNPLPGALRGILGLIHKLLPNRDASHIDLSGLIQKIAPQIQNASSRIQDTSNNGTLPVDVNVPEISQLPDLNNIQPGALRNLLGQARQDLQTRLNLGDNIPQALTGKIEEALRGTNALGDVGNIVQTIIQTYADVSKRSILLGGLVMAEGIRLSGQVAQSSSNVTVGLRNNTQPSTTAANPSDNESGAPTTTAASA